MTATLNKINCISHEEFNHIRCDFDSRIDRNVATLMPGDYFVSPQARDNMAIYTVLGSCISICMRDPLTNVAGMNHFMLPEPDSISEYNSWGDSGRYGSYAMELLINSMMRRGGARHRFEVKAIGGANLAGFTQIGTINSNWVLEYLKREGFSPVVIDLEGNYPRKLYYFLDTGLIRMKIIKRLKNDTIQKRESSYLHNLKALKKEED